MSRSRHLNLKSIHPFPARMAPDIAFREVPSHGRLRVLDPMSGSGTTAVVARLKGHRAVAFDVDPLAILISRCWSSTVDTSKLEEIARRVLTDAREHCKTLRLSRAYPSGCDSETKAFIRYWFDATSRKQLASLARSISKVRDKSNRLFLWCAFSKLIITKSNGVSLAMDVSHSRPHRVYDCAPVKPFDIFEKSVGRITKCAPFQGSKISLPEALIKKADARNLPLRASSIDLIVTSPPYLNAIDYLRGHRLSLVWFGQSVARIRSLRACSVGTDRSLKRESALTDVESNLCEMKLDGLGERDRLIVGRYAVDVSKIMTELFRVLRPGGKAVFVLGDCLMKGVFIENSRLFKQVAKQSGFDFVSSRRRLLVASRRYLPPPTSSKSGKELQGRMRYEVILKLRKPSKRKSEVNRSRKSP